jgi:putative acetyltransferase
MNVRSEEPADHGAIRAVHMASSPTVCEARSVDAPRAARRLCVPLVAEEQRQVVGHAAFGSVRVIGRSDGVGLGQGAVFRAFRRGGIGEQLIRDGLAVCSQSFCTCNLRVM